MNFDHGNNNFNNPQDPLLARGLEDPSVVLLRTLAKTIPNGTQFPVAMNAVVNLFVNLVRQSCPRSSDAEKVYDEFVGKARAVLLEHYDSVTGSRKNIFPFTQVMTQQIRH